MSVEDPLYEHASPSDVWPPPPIGQPVDTLPQFKPMNFLLLIMLYIGSLGFYQLVWLTRNIDIANARCGRTLMSQKAVWFIGVIWVIGFASAFANLSPDADRSITLATNIATLIVMFMVRTALYEALNVHAGRAAGDRTYLGKIWTFLFGILYFQYKINAFVKKNPHG